jgi:hypothetical protein
MTDPDNTSRQPERNVGLWVVVSLMAAIVVGGLTYGLSHPAIYDDPPQTVGSAAQHARSGHPM